MSKIEIKSLTKEEVKTVYMSATNIRDKFLIKLLFETGMRIEEALSLLLEDIIYDHRKGHRIKIVNRGVLSNETKKRTLEREIYISQELIDLFDDYAYDILDELEIDNKFVFVKLKGENEGKPLDYHDVNTMFKRLVEKTGIDVNSEILRRTNAIFFYNATKDIEYLQERLGHLNIESTIDILKNGKD